MKPGQDYRAESVAVTAQDAGVVRLKVKPARLLEFTHKPHDMLLRFLSNLQHIAYEYGVEIHVNSSTPRIDTKYYTVKIENRTGRRFKAIKVVSASGPRGRIKARHAYYPLHFRMMGGIEFDARDTPSAVNALAAWWAENEQAVCDEIENRRGVEQMVGNCRIRRGTMERLAEATNDVE